MTSGRKRWVVLVLGLILIATGAGFAVWWYSHPDRARDRRWANERSAARMIGILVEADEEFRLKDRDGNGIQDFWTGDVAGLYRFGLVERSVAEADFSPLNPLIPKPIPKDGYFFVALRMDKSETPPEAFAQDTDKKSGKVHHLTKYGFCAFPAESGVTGNYVFLMSKDHQLWRADVRNVPIPQDFPSDAELKNYWSRPQ